MELWPPAMTPKPRRPAAPTRAGERNDLSCEAGLVVVGRGEAGGAPLSTRWLLTPVEVSPWAFSGETGNLGVYVKSSYFLCQQPNLNLKCVCVSVSLWKTCLVLWKLEKRHRGRRWGAEMVRLPMGTARSSLWGRKSSFA